MSLIYTAPAGVSSPSGLYIGGKKEAKSRSTLERLGITHVLNVTPPKDSSIQVSVGLLVGLVGNIGHTLHVATCSTHHSYLVSIPLSPLHFTSLRLCLLCNRVMVGP